MKCSERVPLKQFYLPQLTESDKLSKKICITCNSLLARYSALKKIFTDNQNKLHKLLIATTSQSTKDQEDQKTQEEQTTVYTITEPTELVIEPQDVTQRFQIEELHEQEIVLEETTAKPFETISKFKLTSERRNKELFEDVVRLRSEKADKLNHSKSGSETAKRKLRKIHQCEECFYETNLKSSYLNHQWKIHGGSKPEPTYICEICSKGFFRNERLKRHLDRHNNIKRYFCDQCMFATHAKNDLAKHLLTHLTFNDPRVCHKCEAEGCGAVYRWKVSLTNHIKLNHLKEKLVACNLCSKSFTREAMLRNHVRFVHFKERPFSCDVKGCDVSFSCTAHLKRHTRNIHSGKM